LDTIVTYDTYKSTRRRWRERFPGTFYNPIDIKWPGRDEFGGALPFLTGVHEEKNGGSENIDPGYGSLLSSMSDWLGLMWGL